MGLTIGIDTPSHLPVAKPSSTKLRRYADRGHREEQMLGIWGQRLTITGAIYILSRKHGHTEFRDRQNSSHSTAKYQT
jgi:hypothetical protein